MTGSAIISCRHSRDRTGHQGALRAADRRRQDRRGKPTSSSEQSEAGKRVLMLTHRREILRQTSLKIPIDHGLIQAGLNIDLRYPVQVASIQTLWARCMRTDKVSLPAADLIIIDEAHHIAARTWRLILEQYPNARLIGLTATPCRADGRGLGNYFDRIIVGPQIPELIEQKHLVQDDLLRAGRSPI